MTSQVVEGIKNELSVFEEDLAEFDVVLENSKTSQELLIRAQDRIMELYITRDRQVENCRLKLAAALGNKLRESSKQLSNINHLNEASEVEIFGEFTNKAKVHRDQCPYFLYNIIPKNSNLEEEPKHIKAGSAESALWLNDLLNTYIIE